jgi:superfamily II DNA or RNA helicase
VTQLALAHGAKVGILVGTLRARFTTPYPRAVVDAAISCYRKNYFFTTAYKQRRWDGKLHLLTPSGTFPAGVAPLVVEALSKAGHPVEILVPEGSKPLPVVNSVAGPFGGFVPWAHQHEAVEKVLKIQRGVIRIGTGGGKTLVGAMIAHAFDAPALVLVHGQQLVDQTYEKFCNYLGPERVGMQMAEVYKPGKFLIGSIDTLASRLYDKSLPTVSLIKGASIVIADEAHRVGKGDRTFRAVLDACPATVRVGMSGTPFTKAEDTDLTLMGCTGPLLYDLPPERLQRSGMLAKAVLTIYEVSEPEGCQHYNWREAFTYLIAGNAPRTRRIMEIAVERARKGKRVLVIGGFSVRFVRHLEEHYRAMKQADPTVPPASFIARRDMASADYRTTVNESVAALRAGTLSILCSTVIFDEGTDVPDLDVVIMAAPTKSFVRVMQRIGRGLRIKEGGHALEVIDFCDYTNRYLIKHFQARLKVYDDEKLFSEVTTHESNVRVQQQTGLASLEQYDEGEDQDEDFWPEAIS